MKIIPVVLVLLLLGLVATPAMAGLQSADRHTQITNIVVTAYDGVRDAITKLLDETVFKEHPKLANQYGDAITLLASFSAIWLLLVVVAAVRKVVGWILLFGWALLTVSIAVRLL